MTSPVAIVGKQTVQRISICFPKREGQSRIRILFLSSLARTLIKSCEDPLSGFAKVFHVSLQHSSDAFEYVSGVIRDVGKAVQRIGKIVHERH